MKPSRIQAIDHVTLEAPPASIDDLRWFYTEVVELDEVSQPEQRAPVLCFRSALIELRIKVQESPQVDPIGCRATIVVPSLEKAVERIEERNLEYQRLSGVVYTNRRVSVRDPAGNRIELKQEWPPFYY